MIAAGTIGLDGIPFGQKGFTAIVHTGVGVYTLTVAQPPANANNYVVDATQFGTLSGEIIWITGALLNQLIIRTFDAADAPADRAFSIVVYDVT